MEVLAIIPARGGSKGIRNKNLMIFGGKTLVANSVIHAQNSDLVSRIIVSTDSITIKDEALGAGAEVPFMRPSDLAEDHVLDLPVFEHALTALRKIENYEPDYVVHLRPTAPYRMDKCVDEAILRLVNDTDADSVRSVSEPQNHPYRVFSIENGYLVPIMRHEHPEPHALRRQDLPKLYYYNCVIDVTKPSTIFNKKSMTGDRIHPYIMDPEEVIDIDTLRDLEIANLMFANRINDAR